MSIKYRAFNINITCAEGIKEVLRFVNFLRKSKVYAVVSVTGDSPSSTASRETPLAKYFGENPVWNFPMRFYLEESKLQGNALNLRIQLRQKGIFGGDEDVAESLIPLKNLIDGNVDDVMDENYGSSWLLTPSGGRRGRVYYSYYFSGTYIGTAGSDGSDVVAPPWAWERSSQNITQTT